MSIFHIGSLFCFFPAIFLSSTYTDKDSPFSRLTKHSQFKNFSLPCSNGTFSNCLSHIIIVLPEDDRTDSFREERLGLRYETMILAICASVDVSKYLYIPSLEFSIICEHLPFLLGSKPILRLLLVHRNLAIWRSYPWFWRLSFEMLKILVQWILHKTLNRLLQYHLRVRLDLCISGTVALNPNSWDDRDPLMTQNEQYGPYSLLQRSPFFLWVLTLVSCHACISSVFLILSPLLPFYLVFSWLQA